jgi:hypothetical protein
MAGARTDRTGIRCDHKTTPELARDARAAPASRITNRIGAFRRTLDHYTSSLLRVCSDAPVRAGSGRHHPVRYLAFQGYIFAGTGVKAQVIATNPRTEQRTLNPRVRGSSPWRRTRPDLGFHRPKVFFTCPVCPHAGSVLARRSDVGGPTACQISKDWSRPAR